MKINFKKFITNHYSLITNHQLGFTLIELLIAISIIGILSTLILANLQDARVKARDTQRKNDLKQVKTALRMYYNDYQGYPTGSGEIGSIAWGNPFTVGTITYMKALPLDPLYTAGYTYFYTGSANNESFSIYACLENKSDSSGSNDCGSLTCPNTQWCYKVTED